MAFPFDFIDEDLMTELSNAANKAFLLQRTGGFGSDAPTLTKAVNGTAAGVKYRRRYIWIATAYFIYRGSDRRECY